MAFTFVGGRARLWNTGALPENEVSVELAVVVTAGGRIAELGTSRLDPALVVQLGARLGGVGILGYGVMLLMNGDGTADPARDLLDYGLEDEFEGAAVELGLPIWDGEESRRIITGPADLEEPPPWSMVRIVLMAEGSAEGIQLNISRVLWLADRLGGDALLSYGVRLRAQRELRLDGYILDDAWCDELCGTFSRAVAELGLLDWPIERITIQPAHEHPASWAEERRYRAWPISGC
jgi:hypothetical protein